MLKGMESGLYFFIFFSHLESIAPLSVLRYFRKQFFDKFGRWPSRAERLAGRFSSWVEFAILHLIRPSKTECLIVVGRLMPNRMRRLRTSTSLLALAKGQVQVWFQALWHSLVQVELQDLFQGLVHAWFHQALCQRLGELRSLRCLKTPCFSRRSRSRSSRLRTTGSELMLSRVGTSLLCTHCTTLRVFRWAASILGCTHRSWSRRWTILCFSGTCIQPAHNASFCFWCFPFRTSTCAYLLYACNKVRAWGRPERCSRFALSNSIDFKSRWTCYL